MRYCVILSGASGSGKSSYIGQCDHPNSVVSADHYFEKNGEYKFDPSKLSEAHGLCFYNFIEWCRQPSYEGMSIYVDNSNTTVEEIAPYILGASAYGVTARIVTLMATPSDAQLLADRNRHGVNEKTIRAQLQRIQARKLPPWWNNTNIPAALHCPTY